ncbi:hypothetical protein [Nocardioides donggukensis]|uniref:Uncharacterized protein n=1 Tax=Nocardioides donggukensis TaxID=2774019 RepID=A0A927K4M0_9ACTN|nr:hypothetical protein [Nocardioides donggukensis]MBD8868838.1 hypothetical protein [Nocardioides donggukensis]
MSKLPEIRRSELEAECAQLLPARETLSCQIGCVNVTNIVGVNIALAVNAASINSSANALAMQYLSSVQY